MPAPSQDRLTLLVVEDDRALAVGLDLNLTAEGFDVLIAGDGAAGLELADSADLILLDLRLPDMDGLDVLADLRARGRHVPVIILTARGEDAHKIRGLDTGADDYFTKPFSLGELIARINAALRRSQHNQQQVVRIGVAEINLGSRLLLLRSGAPVRLTAREFDLLAYLIDNPGRAHSRDALLTAVWGYDYEGTARTVGNFVRNLRLALEPEPNAPEHLTTVHGVGYRLDLRGRED